jgi:hypothetical protein
MESAVTFLKGLLCAVPGGADHQQAGRPLLVRFRSAWVWMMLEARAAVLGELRRWGLPDPEPVLRGLRDRALADATSVYDSAVSHGPADGPACLAEFGEYLLSEARENVEIARAVRDVERARAS